MGWNIVEDESYERAVAQLGGHERIDEALSIIMLGLHRNPLGFTETVVPGIRIAKTKLRISERDVLPAYRLWFRAEESTMLVTLLMVELAPPQDMGFWDDDEIPF